jgi:hypothetical protein
MQGISQASHNSTSSSKYRLKHKTLSVCWKLRHTQYSSHWNDGFGATDRVSCIDLSKFYSSGDPLFLGDSPGPAFSAVV